MKKVWPKTILNLTQWEHLQLNNEDLMNIFRELFQFANEAGIKGIKLFRLRFVTPELGKKTFIKRKFAQFRCDEEVSEEEYKLLLKNEEENIKKAIRDSLNEVN
jgi:hypothetical protein